MDTIIVDEITALLDCSEWDADTLDQIAELIRSTGREVREPD
jgi:hypothetical protein